MRKFIFLILLVQTSLQPFAQVKYGKEIELGNQLMMCNESAIAVNPKNIKHQVVATNVKHMFWSRNGGKKYKHRRMSSSHGVYGDPVLLYDDQESVYYAHLSHDKTKKWPDIFDKIVVQKSTRNGRSWSDGAGIGKNGKMQDKPWLSFDANPTSKGYGNLYLTWTEFDKYESKNPKDSSRILFSVSKDRGQRFSTPVQINDKNGDCLDGDNTVEGATTCAGPHGELWAVWAGQEKLYLDQSRDGGKTWGKDKIIASIPWGWDLDVPDFMRTNGLPFINSDAKGKLFVSTAYEINGLNQVAVLESNTLGDTWSEPILLQHEDSAHYCMPHSFLDKNSGLYGVIYYKVKNKMINVLVSYKKSTDSKFKTIRLNKYAFATPGRGLFFGDYINICIVNNMLACTWTETKGIATVVKTRRVWVE